MRRLLSVVLTSTVRLYQVTLGRMIPRTCRFYPSCSQYALEALHSHGPYKGTWLAVKRILRCHPFHPGGYDPVPEPEKK